MKSRAHVKTAAFALAIAAGLCRLPVDAQPAGIEHVDFRDGTAFFSNEIHRLKSGRLAAPDKTDTVLWAAIEPPAFGYVAGYPSELAAILVHFGDRGGTGFFSELNLFSLREGKLVMIADLPGGDRAEGGFHSVKISDGRLVVEVYAPPAGGGGCCPAYVDTVRYRFAGGKLVKAGKASRRQALQDKDY